jgi:tetratricopeptide (TPR) repeat protein
MYLRGSKWSVKRRKRRSSPLTIILLLGLIGAGIYINEVIVPETPPLFLPTPTPTRSPESYLTEAKKLESEGKLVQAVQTYRESLLVNPGDPAVYLAIANLQVWLNQYQEALDNAGNALLVNANNPQALALRGYILGLQGQYLDAESVLEEAIRLDPNNPVPYAYLAEVLVLRAGETAGDLDTLNRAIDYSRKAESFGPNVYQSLRARGLVLELTSNYAEAVEKFEAAIAINPHVADIYLMLGRNYRILGDTTSAIRAFNEAIPLIPTDPLPYTYLARTYATSGEFALAIQYGELAIERDPTNPTLYGNLGVFYYRNYDYPKAISVLRLAVSGGTAPDGEVVEGLPLDYWPVSEYYYMFGLALARQGECGEAIPIAQAILEGVSIEETSVANAQEILSICESLLEESD